MPIAADRRSWRLYAPHDARGARFARRRVTAVLTGVVAPEVLADVAAVAAELVGNAVRHAAALPGGVVRVDWQMTEQDGVEIRVTDGGSTAVPEVQHPEPDSIGGRGLTIVAALAIAWGVERAACGQSVWAEIRGLGCRTPELPAPLG